MFKDSISKLVPNQLSSGQVELDYAKPQKLKAKVKHKISREPLQDQINRLTSLQNCTAPVKINIERCQNEVNSDQSEKQEQRNLELDEKVVAIPVSNAQTKQSAHLRKTFTIKEEVTQECIEQKLKQKEEIDFKNQVDAVRESIKKIQKKKKKTKNRELAQIFEERRLNIVKSASANKKIFKLDIPDSSSNEDQQELNQNKITDFKYLNNVICRQNEIKNIFQEKVEQNNETSNNKIVVSSESDPGNENQKQLKKKPLQQSSKRSKFILDNFDSDSQEENKQDDQNMPKSRETIIDQQYEEQLEVVRNMNVQKLKIHFEYVKIDSNFLVFCSIPPQCKTSLIVKRDTEKSQYFVFDSELVSQVIKVEKTIGGVYRFYISRQSSKKDAKPQQKQIAKMKSNFLGTQFHCYAYKDDDTSRSRKYQCISIKYDVNILGLNGPRKIKIYSPTNPIQSETNLLQMHAKSPLQNPNIKVYQSKTPKWMPELNAYVLNLRGTASHSSIKNCIIVDSQNENKEHLIFGKKSKDIFNLELKTPFTVLQGIAFAVSSFQRKLACE